MKRGWPKSLIRSAATQGVWGIRSPVPRWGCHVSDWGLDKMKRGWPKSLIRSAATQGVWGIRSPVPRWGCHVSDWGLDKMKRGWPKSLIRSAATQGVWGIRSPVPRWGCHVSDWGLDKMKRGWPKSLFGQPLCSQPPEFSVFREWEEKMWCTPLISPWCTAPLPQSHKSPADRMSRLT